MAVAYESPHRVRDLVAEFGALYPACPVLAACDLTKKLELLLRGLPAEIVAALDANPKADRGEYTVVFDFSSLPAEEEPPAPQRSAAEWMLAALLDGASLDEAAARAQEQCPRNEVYRAKLRVREMLENLGAAD